MRTNAAFQIATVLSIVVMPSLLAVLHPVFNPDTPEAASEAALSVRNEQVRKLIAEERWTEAVKLAPVAGRVPEQPNTVEDLIQTNLPILIDWDLCAPKSTAKDPEMQRPEVYRHPWVEFYPSRLGADPEGLWAALHLQYSSWPKTAWKVTLSRLDRRGAAVFFHRTLETVHENSGTIEKYPLLENAILKWRVGDHRDVTADPGRLFWISMETLWTEQGNPVRWNEDMPLSLDFGSIENSKMFRAQGLKLEKVDGDVRATVQARIVSWPRNGWRLTLILFDQNGSQVGRGTTTVENSGVVLGYPSRSLESLRFNIPGAREAKESAQRYSLRIERVAASHERQTASVLSAPSTNAASPSKLAGLIAGTTWEWENASERIQESASDTGTDGAANESQPDRSGSRTCRPVSAGETDEPSYPWVVFGRITDSKGNGMSGVTVSASCGWGSLMPTASTNSDAQGNYRMAFGPGRVWFTKSGRVDVAKTIAGTGLQAAIIGASRSGFYEKDLGRQGDLRMAPILSPPDQHPGIAAERIVLPNQPRRVDFVMLPSASINGRVVDADGKPVRGRRFYVVSDKLPPAATVFCEFRPDEMGSFKIGGVPCQSYWLEPAAGSLAGVRSNPLAIPRAGNYEVEISVSEADKRLKARIITAPAPSTGD